MLLRGVILFANVLQIHPGRGIGHIHSLEVLHSDSGHGEVPEPLVVGGDDEPGGNCGAATGECLLVSRRVGLPVSALLVIGVTAFPLLGRFSW